MRLLSHAATVLVVLSLWVGIAVADSLDVQIQDDWVHIGDTTSSNWTDYGGDAPAGASWATTFSLPSIDCAGAALSYEVRDVEATNSIWINGTLVAHPSFCEHGAILTESVPINPDVLLVGSNTLEITLGTLWGSELDDIAIRGIALKGVPEPTTLGLLGLGVLGLTWRRRRPGRKVAQAPSCGSADNCQSPPRCRGRSSGGEAGCGVRWSCPASRGAAG